MPDQPSAPAAPPAQPMAAPASDQSSLFAAAAGAQSRMDGWAPATPADFGSPQPSAQPGDDFAARLAAAQQTDQSKQPRMPQGNQPAPAAAQTPAAAPADTATQPNGLQWQRRKSAEWAALTARAQAAEAKLAAAGNGHQPSDPATNGHAPVAPEDIWKHPEVAKLKTERDQFHEIVKLANAEQDPEFKARFDSEREAAFNVIKRSAGGARDEILEIMGMPAGKARDRALQETIKDFGDSARAEILAANGRLIQVDVNRRIELETRAKTWEQRQAYQANQQGAQVQRREGEMKSAFDKVARKWQDPNAGMPFTIPAAPNDPITTAIRDRAEAILFGKSANYGTEDLANDAMKAATFDHVIQHVNVILDEYEKLQQAYERVTGTQPDGAGSGRFASAVQTAQQAAQPLPPGGRPGHSGYSQILPVLENIPQFERTLEDARRADNASRYSGR